MLDFLFWLFLGGVLLFVLLIVGFVLLLVLPFVLILVLVAVPVALLIGGLSMVFELVPFLLALGLIGAGLYFLIRLLRGPSATQVPPA